MGNMKVATRLGLGFGIVLLLLSAVGLVSYLGTSKLEHDVELILKDRFPKTVQANNIIDQINTIARALRNTLLLEESAAIEKEIDRIAEARRVILENLGELERTIKTDEGVKLLNDIKAARAEYVPQQDRLIALMREGRREAAVAFMMGELRATQNRYMAAVTEIIKYQVRLMEESGQEATEHAQSAIWQVILLSLLAILFGIGIAVLIVRNLMKQLGGEPDYAASMVAAISNGDLSRSIDTKPGDTTSLLASLKQMQENLRVLVGEIDTIVSAANQGDFSKRVEVRTKQGFGKDIGNGLNSLAETTDVGLRDVTRVANALAAGDLSQTITKEYPGLFGQTKAGVNGTVTALTAVVNEIRGIVDAANRGDFSVKLELTGKQGFAKDIAQLLNQLSDTTEVGLKDVTRVANALAAGDLTQTITKEYPGLFGQTKAGVNGTVTALTGVVNEIRGIVDAANRGDFSVKLDLTGKQGFAKDIAQLLNQLSDTTEVGLKDVTRVANALAAGDLTQTIVKEYPGLFGQTKTGVNGTVTALIGVVNEIRGIVDAANQGDFSIKLDLSGKQGFAKDIAQLLNQLSDTTEVGLKDVMRVAQALSQGDLTQTIVKDYPGLFGETKAGVNSTVTNLKELVIRIKEAVDAINTASKEIANGNQDLSQRTEEQASSLEETASSMEELTSTVKQNADNAQQANQLAVSASGVAGKGGEVVRASVDTMAAISESSKKIADIIGVIDGIAFQTNILALNAAVEAARAGEQGRGFAVVAAEVRNLAQRSANAAKEIKSLITDSVAKVDSGTSQVNEAGTRMSEIVDSIKRVTDIMGEISAASAEQSSGIEQVNQAIIQMDDVTQQNAALVEQAAAAAESLEEQAQVLAQAVSVFKLDHGGMGGGMTRHAAPARDLTRSAAHAAPARSGAAKPAAARRSAAKPPPAPPKAKKEGGDDEWEEF